MALWSLTFCWLLALTEAYNGSMYAYARFSTNFSIRGYFLFSQQDSSSVTTVTIELSRLKKLATAYQIRALPFDGHDCNSTGELWQYPGNARAGDLSDKHGGELQPATVLERWSTSETFRSADISLFGPYSIMNRSVVVYGGTPTRPLGCATIISHPVSARVEKFARFFEPFDGFVTFVQFGNEPTEINIDLYGLPLDEDFMICIAKPPELGIPYSYHTYSPRTGDLSGKHFPLRGRYVRQAYVDNEITLSGNETISGMAVVIVDSKGNFVARANIEDSFIWPSTYIYPTGPDLEERPYYWQPEGRWLGTLFCVYVSAVLALNLTWFIRRYTRLRYFVKPSLNSSDEMELLGFRERKLGRTSFYALHSLDVVWFIVFFLGVSDWYYNCQVRSLEALCQIGSYALFGSESNLHLLVYLWTVALVWFSGLLLSKNVLRNYYRQPCALAEAECVLVRVRNPPPVVATVFPSPVVRLYRRMCTRVHLHHTAETLPVQRTDCGSHYITFRCCRLVYSDTDERFAIRPAGLSASFGSLRSSPPLSSTQAAERLAQVGPNVISFSVDPLTVALKREFTRYFYLYQLLIYCVWMWYGYLFVAVIMINVVLGAAVASIVITRSNQKAIEAMTRQHAIVTALRDGEWRQLDSTLLVPGDHIKVGPGTVACDLVLLEGLVVVDESSLTGESRPLRKSPLPSDKPATEYSPSSCASHSLFAGTRLLQVHDNTLALVHSTAMATSKGQLVEKILFPRKMLFKYDEEMVVVVSSLMAYGFLCTVLTIWFIDQAGGESNYVIKFGYGVFTMSQVLNPLLPLSMVIGQTKASARLRKQGICCVEPSRITISGKVRCFCFDKTGTLTKEGLDLIGVHERDGASFKPQPSSQACGLMERGLACCHALTQLGGTLVGNEVEASMFKSTGWTLEDSRVVSPEGRDLVIVKRFEFNHKRATMSVLAKDEDGHVHIFCKGSAEAIGTRCSQKTLPDDYASVASAHALGGMYVLSLAYRNLGELSTHEIANMTQDDAEQELRFVGLILFRNEVKMDTADSIRGLKQGLVRCVMITGDNAQCAYYVAKQTALVDEDAKVILGQVVEGKLEWAVIGSDDERISDPLCYDELAVTGEAFDMLCREGLSSDYLLKIRLFARMSPEGKMRVVELLIAKGLVVGMCGDGGNDCGALRTAHVGVALSDAEASVVSPFTSKSKSIRSVLGVLLEGRCALANSFANYKFLVTYGLLFAILSLVGVRLGTVLPQFDYMFLDVCVMMCMSYTMSLTRPRHVLHPRRPTSALFGPATMGSVLGLHFIQMSFLLFGFLLVTGHDDFVRFPAYLSKLAAFWFLGDNWESTVLFTFFVANLSSSAITFSLGSESRQGLRANKPLVACWIFCYGTFTLALLLNDCWFTRMFHISSHQDNRPHTDNPIWREWQLDGHNTSAPMSFLLRFSLWCLFSFGNVLGVCWERFVIMGPVARWFERENPSIRPVLKI